MSTQEESGYTPISCAYYDHLEAIAVQRRRVDLSYYSDVRELVLAQQVLITDFTVENKVEYLILEDGQRIRLDHLLTVDGRELAEL